MFRASQLLGLQTSVRSDPGNSWNLKVTFSGPGKSWNQAYRPWKAMEMQIAGATNFSMSSPNDYLRVKNFGHVQYLVALSSHQLLLMTFCTHLHLLRGSLSLQWVTKEWEKIFFLSLRFNGHFPGGPGLAGTRMQ